MAGVHKILLLFILGLWNGGERIGRQPLKMPGNLIQCGGGDLGGFPIVLLTQPLCAKSRPSLFPGSQFELRPKPLHSFLLLQSSHQLAPQTPLENVSAASSGPFELQCQVAQRNR